MIATLKTLLSVLMTILNVFSFAFFGDYAFTDKEINPDEVRLTMAVISDTHINTEVAREQFLELGLYEMQNSDTHYNALVINGDMTDHGYPEQYDLLKKALSGYTPADEIILVQGNHDSWTRDGSDFTQQELFISYNKSIANREINNVYYSGEINGYPYIVLGSESDNTSAYFSDEQLNWFKNEMDKAAEKGLPIFVFSHWPVNGTHGLPQTFSIGDTDYTDETGGIGEQSDEVDAILKQYKNVFFINGHIHEGFSKAEEPKSYEFSSAEDYGSYHSINLPSYTNMSIFGRIANGTGFQIEVYDDEVVLRAKSFSAGVWYTCYDHTIPLV